MNRARLILGTLLALMVFGLLPSSHPPSQRAPPAGAGDAFLHLATIDRLRSGERYYTAVGEELRRGHYPATRVFNWRTPAHFLIVAGLSVPVATFVLKALAFTAILLTPLALGRESLSIVLLGSLAQLGAVATAFKPMAVGVAEVWAGVLLALSLCAYFRHQWVAAAILGVMALFIRELAAPYCLVCGLLALGARRRHESYVWAAGAFAYAVYFGAHVTQVWTYQLPGDLTQTESWVRWNGLEFTLATLNVNGWIGLAPRWTAVLYMVLALAGTASPRVPRQVAVPLLTYFVLFAFAGQPFNYYWGWVTAPIWAFAAGYGVEGVRWLIVSARRPHLQPVRRA